MLFFIKTRSNALFLFLIIRCFESKLKQMTYLIPNDYSVKKVQSKKLITLQCIKRLNYGRK